MEILVTSQCWGTFAFLNQVLNIKQQSTNEERPTNPSSKPATMVAKAKNKYDSQTGKPHSSVILLCIICEKGNKNCQIVNSFEDYPLLQDLLLRIVRIIPVY